MIPRDRDPLGRPRNARPRDRSGRPLPRGSRNEAEDLPDDLDLTPAQTLAYAQQLLDDGQAFTAHEVFEVAWKRRPNPERDLWQGLAQLAVGLTHLQRGNLTGAVSLLRRSADRLATSAPHLDFGVDLAGLMTFSTALADDLAAGVHSAAQRRHPRLVG